MATTIEFEVEDGSAKSNSTSYIDIDFFKQYWCNKGVSKFEDTAYTEDIIKGLLNRATQTIDMRYFFQGHIVDEDQALQCPRYYLYDKNDCPIDHDIVPIEVARATAEMANYLDEADKAAGSKYQDANRNPKGIKSKKLGPGSITYTDDSQGNTSAIEYPNCDIYLWPLTDQALRV